jgi:hypothetical protein
MCRVPRPRDPVLLEDLGGFVAVFCNEVKARVAPAPQVIKVFRDARLLTFAFD